MKPPSVHFGQIHVLSPERQKAEVHTTVVSTKWSTVHSQNSIYLGTLPDEKWIGGSGATPTLDAFVHEQLPDGRGIVITNTNGEDLDAYQDFLEHDAAKYDQKMTDWWIRSGFPMTKEEVRQSRLQNREDTAHMGRGKWAYGSTSDLAAEFLALQEKNPSVKINHIG